MFAKYNALLRGAGAALAGCKGNTYRTTMHVINSCIIKTSKLTRAVKVYRGIAGAELPPTFWTPNEYNVRGGIESAFLSTTVKRQVAVTLRESNSHSSDPSRPAHRPTRIGRLTVRLWQYDYASRPGKPGIVFEMQMGMIDRGAELKWLSQYPHEEEILRGADGRTCTPLCSEPRGGRTTSTP